MKGIFFQIYDINKKNNNIAFKRMTIRNLQTGHVGHNWSKEFLTNG